MDGETDIGRFLGMVGAIIWCPSTERYLILKRSGDKDFGGGTWECGSGRVDQGESFSQALRREIKEELGVEVQMDFIVGTAHFYRGEERPENEMIGVFYCCSLDNPESIRMSWEHSELRWVTPELAAELLPADNWLAQLINRADFIRQEIPTELIQFNRMVGFDL